MTDTSAASSTEVEHLLSRGDVDLVETTEDTSSELGTEGVPNTVLSLRALDAALDRYPLLAVDSLSGDEVLGDEQTLLALRDENTRVPVGLEDHVRAAARTTPSAATGSSPATRSTATASTTLEDASTAASAVTTAETACGV